MNPVNFAPVQEPGRADNRAILVEPEAFARRHATQYLAKSASDFNGRLWCKSIDELHNLSLVEAARIRRTGVPCVEFEHPAQAAEF